MTRSAVTHTDVAIVGAGPAGLMLSHLLALNGIDSVAVDVRSRRDIELTHRAGILERDSVRMLVDTGVSERVLRDGHEHQGIDLRYGGRSHRVDFQALVGASTWLYPQTDVFIDLADARQRDGGDVRFAVSDTQLLDVTGDHPAIRFTDSSGASCEIRCRYVVGADGSRSMCRLGVPEAHRRQYFREYPFAWFGILAEAPISAPELIYARSERGFALVSQRTEMLQRMYFQCDPQENLADWPEDRIWQELQDRLAGEDGFSLRQGPIVDKSVLPFRSFVQEPMRYGNLMLVGDAAHTVPPTGAKGLNLALADVRVLAELLYRAVGKNDGSALDEFSARALSRVWKAQHFSYWMTAMLHQVPEAADFDTRRQLGELDAVTSSQAGQRFLAEAYTGWPSQPLTS